MASYTIQPSNGCPESGRWPVDRLWINGTDYSDMLAFFGVCLYKQNVFVMIDYTRMWRDAFAKESFKGLCENHHAACDIMIDLKGQPMRVFECELVEAEYAGGQRDDILAQLFFNLLSEQPLLNQDIEYFHKQGRQNA